MVAGIEGDSMQNCQPCLNDDNARRESSLKQVYRMYEIKETRQNKGHKSQRSTLDIVRLWGTKDKNRKARQPVGIPHVLMVRTNGSKSRRDILTPVYTMPQHCDNPLPGNIYFLSL